jgi:hypothetical protein
VSVLVSVSVSVTVSVGARFDLRRRLGSDTSVKLCERKRNCFIYEYNEHSY